MAWTQADLDAIDAVIKTGTLTVRYGGPPSREVTYRSMSELIQLRGMIASSISNEQGTAVPRCSLATFRND